MKNLLSFLKTIAVGGLLVMLPLLLFLKLVKESMAVCIALATPIAKLFPEGTFADVQAPVPLAIAILFLSSFLLGLSMRSALILRLGRKLDERLLVTLPAYRALKSFSRGLFSAGDESGFRAAILSTGEDRRELVYVTEDLGGEWLTVLHPWAPTSFAGPLQLVKREHIHFVDISLMDASGVFGNFGVGSLELLARCETSASAPSSQAGH